MAQTGLELEPEVLEIFEHISSEHNFLLSGGAGSGKTYSLVQFIQESIRLNPTSKIACMTYTNAAVKEIEERVSHENLQVSTIHDFLWDNIKSFQNELKKSLIQLINDESVGKIKSPDGIVDINYYDRVEGIQYKEFTVIKDGIISHDEILILANYMFKTYSKLCDILKDKFKFILIDEYQDTNPAVVEIFLKHIKQSSKKNIIGFFGDSMQSIYDDGIGDLNAYIAAGDVYEVKKEQNRRNPRLVIELANRLRTDRIEQHPSTDINAPNMQENRSVKDGKIAFYYSLNGVDNLEVFKEALDWDFANAKDTKELNLTHNLIAPKAGFGELMEIYDDDKILDYKKRITDYIKEKNIQTDFSEKTFGEVIDILLEGKTGTELNKVKPTDGMQTFIDGHTELFEEAKQYPFDIFKKIYLDKDSLIADTKKDKEDENKKGSKRDDLIKHLFKIQSSISLYKEGRYNEFLRKTEYRINSIADKLNLKETVETLDAMADETIESVIDYAHEKGICRKDDKLNHFIQNKSYVFNQVKKLKFNVFQNLFRYLEGYTPFSTQHKIKGAEFNNVLVVLDNGDWKKYNFEYLMNEEMFESLAPAKKSTFPKILNRTQKIFYVCCTRAKENLVVFYNQPSPEIIEKAKLWFGEVNVHTIDE